MYRIHIYLDDSLYSQKEHIFNKIHKLKVYFSSQTCSEYRCHDKINYILIITVIMIVKLYII